VSVASRVGPLIARGVVALGAAAAVSASCSRDRSALEQDPTQAGGGGGAAVSTAIGLVTATTGDGGYGAFGVGNGGRDPSSSNGQGGDGGARPVEPDGPNRVVVVHGIADRDRLAFCFASPAGEGLAVAPFPKGGLWFAGVADVDVEALPTSGDAVVMVVSGAEIDLEEASCAKLLAEPGATPELEVAALGLVPEGALSAPRILVLAATGCLGGEDHENELMEQACGAGYGALSPTASLVAASPSRLAAPDRLGIQSIGASLAAAPFDVLLRPNLDGVPFRVTEALSWGASAPFPPNQERAAVYVGVPAQLSTIVTLPNDDEVPLDEIDLAGAAERAGINTFSDGEAITIAFVGAQPGLGDGPWWHGFDAVLIPKDP